jgi:hypothetical protein
MANDREEHNGNPTGTRDDDDPQLGRSVFLRHAVFSSPDSLARDTIRRYASFLGRTADITIARWTTSGEGRGDWLNLEWLRGVSPVRRKAISRVAKQAAVARSVSVPAAENKSLTSSAPELTFAGRVEGSATPAPLEPESPVSGGLAIAGVPSASTLTAAGGVGPSIHRAHTRIETDRARTDLPTSGDDRKPHPAPEHQGQPEHETIPRPGIEPSASFTSTPAFTGGIPGGHPTIHSTVTERRAAKTFHGPPIFQRSHIRRVSAAEGHAGRSENLVSASAGQDASPMPSKLKAPGDAASPVEPALLRTSALGSANGPESFDAQQVLHKTYSQPDSAESTASDSAAAASPVGTSAESNNTSSLAPATLVHGHPVQSAIQRHRDAARNSNPPLLAPTSDSPAHIARDESAAGSRAAHSPSVTPKKSTLSAIPKENSSSPGHTADPKAVAPEAVSAESAQVNSTIGGLGESTHRFLQSRRAAALYVPAVQRFGESLLQRHRSALVASAGTEAGSRMDSAASGPVVQLTAIPLHEATLGNQSSHENPPVLRSAALDPTPASKASPLRGFSPGINVDSHLAARDPEHLVPDRDIATPDSKVETQSFHSIGQMEVVPESTVLAPGSAEIVLARHASSHSTTANRGEASFAGATSEPIAVQNQFGSIVADANEASPLSLAGFDATLRVSHASPNAGGASRADTPKDVLRPQSWLQSGQHSAAHREVRAPGQSLPSSLPPHSTIGDSAAASLAGAGSEPAAHERPISTLAGTGPAGPAGFETLPMVSRTSLKTGVATSAGVPADMVRPHLQGLLRFGPQSTAYRDATAARQAVQPSFYPDARHAILRAERVEHPQSGDLTLHKHGTMTETNYVLGPSAGPVYARRDEQPVAVAGGINLQHNASVLTLASGASAARNRIHPFLTSATPSRHSFLPLVPMHHAQSSVRGPQGVAPSAQGDLLFRSALSSPAVPATPGSSLSGFPSVAQPASPTASNFKNVDVAQLANRVYDLLVRRLSSERQRRGM